jgi:hypothetical protein
MGRLANREDDVNGATFKQMGRLANREAMIQMACRFLVVFFRDK